MVLENLPPCFIHFGKRFCQIGKFPEAFQRFNATVKMVRTSFEEVI